MPECVFLAVLSTADGPRFIDVNRSLEGAQAACLASESQYNEDLPTSGLFWELVLNEEFSYQWHGVPNGYDDVDYFYVISELVLHD